MATAELKLFDANGKQVGTTPASASVFQAPIAKAVLHEVVRWQRAKRRSGTHSTLTRAEASGGGAKPWKQKGTGRARAGSNTSPLWVGGGIAHGPKPRDYEFSLNRKQRRLAICSALSARAQDEKCLVVKDFGLTEVKTKTAAEVLSKLGIERTTRATIIVTDDDDTARKSFRNLPRVSVLSVRGLNVYDILNTEYVVISEPALAAVQERLDGDASVEKSAAKKAAPKAKKSSPKAKKSSPKAKKAAGKVKKPAAKAKRAKKASPGKDAASKD